MTSVNEETEGPTVIAGRYTVGRTLGRGGMAVVCQVVDSVTGRELALKRLLPEADALRRKRSVELFEREFHTLSQLTHPNVVAAYDFGVDGGDPYYTMELLSGGDLVDRAPVPHREACSLARFWSVPTPPTRAEATTTSSARWAISSPKPCRSRRERPPGPPALPSLG